MDKHPDQLIYQLLQAKQQFANNIAIFDMSQALTYNELYIAIDQYAKEFNNLGLTAGHRVVVTGEKSAALLIAMFACLLNNITYIPLESPQAPERLKLIVKETNANAIIHIEGDITVFDKQMKHPSDTLIFYTSGSTGTPKGIRINSANIISFINWAINQFNMSASDRVSSFAPWHFDLSLLDIFATLSVGATVHCVPTSIRAFPYQLVMWMIQQQITMVYMVPTALRHLIKHGGWNDKIHSIRCILFAGETYPLLELKKLRAAFHEATIANLYGPTETNVCTWQSIPNTSVLAQWTEVPIGNPLPGFDICVVNEKGEKLTQINQIGELICSGPSVSTGYINPDLSSFIIRENIPSYKTGDLVKITQLGYVFMGRQDRQFKHLGHRIDPIEIESILCQHEAVSDAAVCIHDNFLIAFIVINQNINAANLKQYTAKFLPQYCCPRQYIFLETIPRTTTDKVNYNQLIKQSLHYEVN